MERDGVLVRRMRAYNDSSLSGDDTFHIKVAAMRDLFLRSGTNGVVLELAHEYVFVDGTYARIERS